MSLCVVLQSPYRRYGRELNTHDSAKFIALILMIIDHMGVYLYPDNEWLRIIGRGSMPIWLFLVGYTASTRFKPEILAVACALVVYRFWLHGELLPLNILCVIIVAKYLVPYLQRVPSLWVWVLLLLWIPLSRFIVEYGSFALLMAYVAAKHRRKESSVAEWIMLWVCYVAIEINALALPMDKSLILVMITMLVWIGVYRYQLETVSLTKGCQWLAPMVKVGSRYSLYIYGLHLMVLMAIEAVSK